MENKYTLIIATALISLLIGGSSGYYINALTTKNEPASLSKVNDVQINTENSEEENVIAENLTLAAPNEETDENYWRIPEYTKAFLALVQTGNSVEESLAFALSARSDRRLLELPELKNEIAKLNPDGLIANESIGVILEDARARTRDAKRVSDVKQIQTALELFFADNGFYPKQVGIELGEDFSCIDFGNGFSKDCSTSNLVYMSKIPKNPQPGGTIYKYNAIGDAYVITFALEEMTGTLEPGLHTATPEGIK